VSDWQVIWLGVMAAALVVMALMQVGLVLVALRTSRQVTLSIENLRRDVRPVIDRVNRLADEAGRTTALALSQVERLDRFLAITTSRVEEVLTVVRASVGGPLRQGTALMMGLRAVIGAIRQWQDTRPARPARREEDDPLFVG
jgi:hypothetical protein